LPDMTGKEKHPGGRPLKFKTVEELQAKIDSYFKDRVDESGTAIKPVTITGLALHLDTSRETLMDYQERDEFSDAIKRAKLRIENYYEENLMTGKPTGPIFALKNFGWKDHSTVHIPGHTPLSEEDRALLAAYAKNK